MMSLSPVINESILSFSFLIAINTSFIY